MGNYNRDDRGGQRRDFGRRDSGRPRFGDRGRAPREMYKAICSNCGRECMVPFRPTGEKPVYCSDCFEKMGNRDNRESGRRPDFQPRKDSRPQGNFDMGETNRKLDKIIELLTRLTSLSQVQTVPVQATKPAKAKTSKKKATTKEE